MFVIRLRCRAVFERPWGWREFYTRRPPAGGISKAVGAQE